MSTAVATRQTSAIALNDDELIDVLTSSLYPGAARNSVKMVLGYCRAAGLDPMQKPVHIVPMWDGKAKQMRDVVMPGVGLYRTQASRTGNFAGQTEPEFGPMVTTKLSGVEITYPEWARVTVRKLMSNGQIVEFTACEYWIENYAVKGGQEKSMAPNAMWTKRPRGQIAKCAAAQALRLAFPEAGSQPTAEEMEGKALDQDDQPASSGVTHMGNAEEVRPTLPGYSAEDFAGHMVVWTKVIKAGKKDVAGVLATVATVAALTDEQIAAIKAIPAELAKPAAQGQTKTAATDVVEKKPDAALPAMVYADVADALTNATTKEELAAAAALIPRVTDAAFRDELTTMLAELVGAVQ